MKIGIARYPYFKNSLKGGDYVLLDQIASALAEQHVIEEIAYKRPLQSIALWLPKSLSKAIVWLLDQFVAPVFTIQLLLNRSSVDVVIADSTVITHFIWFKFLHATKKPLVIPVINIDYTTYRHIVAKNRAVRIRLSLRLLEFWQRRGAQQYLSVAVSDFVANTFKERGLPLLTVIENVAAGVSCLESACQFHLRKRYVYAGSSDYYGKGIDELEKMAAMGLEIHTYTPKSFKGVIHHPPLPRNQLLLELCKYDLLLFPSRYESFGLIAIEAMALGIPVIMRPTGIGFALREAVPECVVDGDDWAHVAKQRIDLISSNRSYFSNKVRQFAENYTNTSGYNQRWIELVDMLVSEVAAS